MQGRCIDFCSQCCLWKGNGRLAMDIVPVSLEHLVRFDVDDDVEVAWRATIAAFFSLTEETQAATLVDPRWDFD